LGLGSQEVETALVSSARYAGLDGKMFLYILGYSVDDLSETLFLGMHAMS
jgi:hypothetical protein